MNMEKRQRTCMDCGDVMSSRLAYLNYDAKNALDIMFRTKSYERVDAIVISDDGIKTYFKTKETRDENV